LENTTTILLSTAVSISVGWSEGSTAQQPTTSQANNNITNNGASSVIELREHGHTPTHPVIRVGVFLDWQLDG